MHQHTSPLGWPYLECAGSPPKTFPPLAVSPSSAASCTLAAPQTRQALGLGDKDFRPTSLEAQHRALGEASAFGSQLHTLERSLAKWASATDGRERLSTQERTRGSLTAVAAMHGWEGPNQSSFQQPGFPANHKTHAVYVLSRSYGNLE